MGNGGINNTGRGTHRRKPSRRPTVRKVTVYDEEEGDDGFVTGETDEFEMANIRVKVHFFFGSNERERELTNLKFVAALPG